MENSNEAKEIGETIADLLRTWRPKIDRVDVTSVLMHALERYCSDLEGARRGGFHACLVKLNEEIDWQLRNGFPWF